MLDYEAIVQLAGIPLAHAALDEWLHRFAAAISSCGTQTQVAEQKFDETTKPFIRLRCVEAGQECPADVLIAHMDGGFIALCLGWKSEIDQDFEELVFQASSIATAGLGEEGESYEWSALIGPPVDRISGTESRLKDEVEVGPFRLSSTQQVYWEKSPQIDHPHLGTYSVLGCVPIRVRSAHRGYSWDAASVHASRDLNMLCSLLSVAWGTCVVIRSGPLPVSMGEHYVPNRDFWEERDLDDESRLNRPGAKSVPKWTKNAWRVMKGRPKIADAVAMYREGLHAQLRHPSLSLVAFIASIEVVSQAIYRDDKCDNCKGHRFIAKKFTHTLNLVMDCESAEQLGRAYSPRSRTVHQGKLHGTEMTVGTLAMPLWTPDASDLFKWETVYKMSKASRDLLEMALKGTLPAKQDYSVEGSLTG
jgi:hypothetical protein